MVCVCVSLKQVLSISLAAEEDDVIRGDPPPKHTSKDTVQCFDPADGTYLTTLPALSPAEVHPY